MRGKLCGSLGAAPNLQTKYSKTKRKQMAKDEREWLERIRSVGKKLLRWKGK